MVEAARSEIQLKGQRDLSYNALQLLHLICEVMCHCEPCTAEWSPHYVLDHLADFKAHFTHWVADLVVKERANEDSSQASHCDSGPFFLIATALPRIEKYDWKEWVSHDQGR